MGITAKYDLIVAVLLALSIHAGAALIRTDESSMPSPLEQDKKKHLEISFVSTYREEVQKVLPKAVQVRKTTVVRKNALITQKPAIKKRVTAKNPVRTQAEREPVRKGNVDRAVPVVTAEPRPSAVASAVAVEDTPVPKEPVIVEPGYRYNPQPVYPKIARRRGYAGVTLLTADIDARGRVSTVTVKRSSGHDVLDRAACSAVRKWKFEPARRDGVPVPMPVDIPVRFELKGNHN